MHSTCPAAIFGFGDNPQTGDRGPWPNHAYATGGVPESSNSLCLGGNIVVRKPGQLRFAADGGVQSWF